MSSNSPFDPAAVDPSQASADVKQTTLRDALLDYQYKVDKLNKDYRTQQEANIRAAATSDTLAKGHYMQNDKGEGEILIKDAVISEAKRQQKQEGKSYETFQSAMLETVALCELLCDMLQADAWDNFAWAIDRIGRIEAFGFVAEVAAEVSIDIQKKYRRLTNVEKITHSVHVDDQGKLSIAPLENKDIILDPKKLSEQIQKSDSFPTIEKLSQDLNQFFENEVDAWLNSCGYEKDSTDHYLQKAAPHAPLNQDILTALQKYDPAKNNTTLEEYISQHQEGITSSASTTPRMIR